MTEPEVGKRYHVVLHDCCVSSEFTAVLTSITMEDGYLTEAVFDNGVTVYCSHWTFSDWTEVDA